MVELSHKEYLQKKVAAKILKDRSNSASTNNDIATTFIEEATKNILWQRGFIEDTDKHKALFGERRGAKTTLMAICAISVALQKPYSQILYIGLTQDSCQRAMYDGVLSRLLRKHNLPAKLMGGNEMRFENGSIIYLIGLDANKKQKEKVRGVKSSLNMIDEMQSYTQDTSNILNDVLGPTSADTKSSTILGGTAGNSLGKNYWYEITKDNTKTNPIEYSEMHPEWKVYRCEWEKNTAIDDVTGERVCDNVRDYLEELKRKHPGIENTNSFRQEWNAEWIVEKNSLIYKYDESNLLSSPKCIDIGTNKRIPMPSREFLLTATYIIGADLGYNDPTALTVCCYNLKYSNKLYVIETFYKSEMLIPEIAAKLKQLDSHYHFTYWVGDSSSLQVFETLRQIHSFPFEKANRVGKLSHQYVLNSDLQTLSVVIMPGNDELIKQLQTCIWDEKALREGNYVEDQKYKNDLADTFLYAHNYSRHLWYNEPPPKLEPGDYFTQAILKGEEIITKQNILKNNKQKFNPYAIKPYR